MLRNEPDFWVFRLGRISYGGAGAGGKRLAEGLAALQLARFGGRGGGELSIRAIGLDLFRGWHRASICHHGSRRAEAFSRDRTASRERKVGK